MDIQIIESSAVPTFVIDHRHRVTHFNRACENLTNIAAAEIIGTNRQWAPFYARERPILADLIVDGAEEEVIARYYGDKVQRSRVIPGAYEAEDFFPDLGERGRWLFFTAAPLHSPQGATTGAVVTIQDVTREKQAARQNEAMLRISQALPEYPVLGDLLDYISREIMDQSAAEGALVILLDEKTREHDCVGAAYANPETKKRVKRLRFGFDQLAAGEVVATAEPRIINDAGMASAYPERDSKMGYRTRNLAIVPLKSAEKVIGVLAALNKLEGGFDQTDVELLNSIAGTVTLSIENARIAEELKRSYAEVCALNRTKDRAITHLSHELKTPVAILSGALDMLADVLDQTPEEEWQATMDMLRRNLSRIAGIQAEVNDIMKDRPAPFAGLVTRLFEQARDELSLIVAREAGAPLVVEEVRDLLRKRYLPEQSESKEILIGPWLEQRVKALSPSFAHRQVMIDVRAEGQGSVFLPEEVLQKIVDGLIRNAVENTPDQGRIDVVTSFQGGRTRLAVRDFGIGIAGDDLGRIFEGLSPLQEALTYSTRRPFDFNAGGKGLDLLRMKIFSEQHGFEIGVKSERCGHIAAGRMACPGRIGDCPACQGRDDCFQSGQTEFFLSFDSRSGHQGSG
mgnify:FL=1